MLAGPKNGDPAAFQDGTILLAFRDGIPPVQQNAIMALIGALGLKRVGAGTHVVRVPNGLVPTLVQFLMNRPEIRYAEPDYVHSLSGGAVPNDASVGIQWAVQNTGQFLNGVAGTPGADARSPLAWSLTTGANAVVAAVLDSGVQYTHPDLATNMWNNPGGIGGCPAGTHGYNVLAANCDPMDDDTAYGGHGTHVAGILGAVGNNGAGVAGVNWTTAIMAVKWVNSSGVGYTSDLITAIDWVITCKQAGVNVRVVNDSATWPGSGSSQALSDAIDLLGANDILFVTAAGNTSQNNDMLPRYPCSYNRPTMICAAASDQNDYLWTSSNYGTTTVQLAAPGANIYSTLRLSNYGYISGGSMAAPQVSGAAALLLSLQYQSVSALRTTILNSVDRIPSLAAYVATGGRLNVCKAVPGCATAVTSTPFNTGAPIVTGLPKAGSVLGASTGTWYGLPTAYTYQWFRCNSQGASCAAIPGAIGQGYPLLAAADTGATFGVQVTGANLLAAVAAYSAPSPPAAPTTSPFAVSSTITDGATISGSVTWQATPAQAVYFVQFFIDGVLQQADAASPYIYSQGVGGSFDTTTLANGTHVLGIRALATDNRTWGFYGATVTVANSSLRAVQSKAVEGAGVRSLSAAFPSSLTASNLIIAFVRMSTATQTVSVTDSAGNVYVDAVSQAQTSDGHQIHLFYAKNVKGGANTVTATFSAANSHSWLAIYEAAGLSQTAPLDRTAAAQGSGATADSGQTATTSDVSELVFAGAGLPASYNGSVSAAGGATMLLQNTGSSRAATEKSVATSTGSFAGVFNLSKSTNWSAVVATFRPAGATASAPSITTTSVPNGAQNIAYATTLAATGGTAPYTWSIIAGSLPAGLALAAGTGVISGSPSGTGTTSFTVKVTDQNSMTATRALGIAIGPGVSNTIALAQSKAIEGSGVSSLSVSFSVANTSGNLILAAVRMSTATQTVSVTDNAGNVYVDAVSQVQTTDGHQIHLFYAKNVKGGANTVKATFSATNSHPWLAIYEYSGLNTANPLDRTAQGQGVNSSAATPATAPTSSASELLFAVAGFPASYGGTATADRGFTLLQQDTGTSRSASEAGLATATGSYTGVFPLTAATNWSAVLATFKP